jgi:hypothetical protein
MSGLSDTQPIEIAGYPVAVYAAMFGATVGGQFLGVALDSAVLGRHLIWVPALCSVVLEAVVGERYGASRLGRAMTFADRGRLSVYYSVCLAALTVPLVMWTAASRSPQAPFGGHDPMVAVGLCLAILVGLTALRTGLMPLFAKRRA